MYKFKNILSFEDFINEGILSKTLNRSKTGEERIEDRIGNHSFTDGNGTFHKYGIKGDNSKILEQICSVITHKDTNKINLNIIDMSDIEDANNLFYQVFRKLTSDYNFSVKQTSDLIFDTSGWNLEKCTFFYEMLDGIEHDIGIETWKINPEYVKINTFKNSYYSSHLPSWFILDIKDWIKSCDTKISYCKYGVDKERTKQLGKKCYWVIFNEGIKLDIIPDEVTIREITDDKNNHSWCRINASKLTSLKKLPSEFINSKKYTTKGFTLHITINNITDDEIIIPKNVSHLFIHKNDDITKLPKEVDYGLDIFNPNQLGHVQKVNGNFSVGNSSISSLVGCPKEVTGDFDAHNCKITDLVGSPEYVGGDFSCSNNGGLKSLKGCPKTVNGTFNFYSTGITSIDDFPEHVQNVGMSGCTHLKNFIGLPEKIDGTLDIMHCNVESLEGLPKEIGKLVIGKLTVNNKPATVEDILKVSPDLKNIRENLYSFTNLIK